MVKPVSSASSRSAASAASSCGSRPPPGANQCTRSDCAALDPGGNAMRRQDGDQQPNRAEVASARADPRRAGPFPPVPPVDQAAGLLRLPGASLSGRSPWRSSAAAAGGPAETFPSSPSDRSPTPSTRTSTIMASDRDAGRGVRHRHQRVRPRSILQRYCYSLSPYDRRRSDRTCTTFGYKGKSIGNSPGHRTHDGVGQRNSAARPASVKS